MALILNLESSTEICSVALSENGKLLALRESTEGQNHARLLSVFVDEIMKELKLEFKQLSAVAVSRGPGSYTGLRIGVSLAKGLCYAHQIPLIAISPLQAMSSHVIENRDKWQLPNHDEIAFCPMIDARRMEVYTAIFNRKNECVEETNAKIIDNNSFSDLLKEKPMVIFGNGANKCKSEIDHPNAFFIDDIKTSAQFMCLLAQKAFENNNFVDLAYFEPFYLKDFIAGKPRKNILKS